MTDYWQSTKSPTNIYKHSYQLQKLETFLRDTYGVDPILLAKEVATQGVGPEQIKAYQRKLGLRKLTGNKHGKAGTEGSSDHNSVSKVR